MLYYTDSKAKISLGVITLDDQHMYKASLHSDSDVGKIAVPQFLMLK